MSNFFARRLPAQPDKDSVLDRHNEHIAFLMEHGEETLQPGRFSLAVKMMDTTAMMSPPKRLRTFHKLVVIGDDVNKYKELFVVIQKKNISITVFKSIDEFHGDPDEVVFFCGDFKSSLFTRLTCSNSNVDQPLQRLIIGPAVLRHRAQTGAELLCLRPCRPLYCDIMKSVTMVIASEVINKRDIVELVHFMGGSVRKESVQKTNVLVALRARGRIYEDLSMLGQPVVKPDWVHECWNHRDDPSFNIFEPELLKKHSIGIFGGLLVYFHGFKKDEEDDMAKNFEQNNGKVAQNPHEASHVVFNSSAMDIDALPSVSGQRQVTQEWLWISLHIGKCAKEETYALPTRALKKKKLGGDANSSMNSPAGKTSKSTTSIRDFSEESASLNATPDYIYSNDDMEKIGRSPRPMSKRLQVCMEMCETDFNYLNAMKLLLRFKSALEEEVSENEFMKKTDIALMFGKLEAVVELHEKIYARLNAMTSEVTAALSNPIYNKKFDDKNFDFSVVWIDAKEEMARVYPPYLNLYDTAKNVFNAIDRENPKFHAFCKAKESNPDFKRQKIADLLVRPVQRLPSVILLLREVAKRSETSRLRVSAEEAARVVDEVLKIANKTREKNDNWINHMNKFTDIENVPVHLMAANRMFIRDIVVTPIASAVPRLKKDCRMKLFMFHDVIIVTKIREERGKMHRLARHASFASLHSRARRPYKYVEQIPLSSLRNACRIRPPEEFIREFIGDPALCQKEPCLWLITHRDDSDQLWVVEAEEDPMKEFLEDLHVKIMSEYGRAFLLCSEETTSTINDSFIADATLRYIKRKMMTFGANVTLAERTPRTTDWSHPNGINETLASSATQNQSKMRRAFSNAQLTIASTFGFGRAHSRANLGQINENSPMVHVVPRPGMDNLLAATPTQDENLTPKRGLRSRLTSSTFLNRTLSRNASSRHVQPIFNGEGKENMTLGSRLATPSRVTDV